MKCMDNFRDNASDRISTLIDVKIYFMIIETKRERKEDILGGMAVVIKVRVNRIDALDALCIVNVPGKSGLQGRALLMSFFVVTSSPPN